MRRPTSLPRTEESRLRGRIDRVEYRKYLWHNKMGAEEGFEPPTFTL